ncbi:MAG: hypothetical protein KJ556_20195 [Gammaproteobacteria bacterium]|nr:hypothetical protein [Gammaproteobacteria bacterium]
MMGGSNSIKVVSHTRTPNIYGKTRPLDKPYKIFSSQLRPYTDWEWRVLKAYQNPEQEARNPYARWFCAVRSPMTFGSWDYGDTYVADIPGAERGSREEWQ